MFENLKNIHKLTIRDEVYSTLKQAIMDGSLSPGERISAGGLTREIGFSLTPIREALLKLEQEGLVSRSSNGGFVIYEMGMDEIQDIYEARCVLEQYVIQFAALSMTSEDLARLDANVLESKQAYRENRLDQVSQLNTAFHEIIYRYCPNKQILLMIDNLNAKVSQLRSSALKVDGMAHVSLNDHSRIVELLKARNVPQLKVLIEEHILKARDILAHSTHD